MQKYKKKIYMDRLFPPPPIGNTYRDLKIDDDSVSYITPYDLAHTTLNILKSHHDDLDKLCAIDMTGGVGGDTIALSARVKHVVSVEIVKERHYMMINNLSVYGINNVFPICGNSMEILEKLDFIDLVYIDPPWGGSSYKQYDKLRLKFADMYLDQVICQLFNPAQLSRIKTCCMKLPLNYDIHVLYMNTKHLNLIHYLYRLEKMFIVVVSRKTT